MNPLEMGMDFMDTVDAVDDHALRGYLGKEGWFIHYS